MENFRVIEGGGRATLRRTPDLKIAREEVYEEPPAFMASSEGWALLETLADRLQARKAEVGDMLEQAAWELYREGVPLTLSSISQRFSENLNRAIVEETRGRLRTAALEAVVDSEPKVKIPEGWRVHTNGAIPLRASRVEKDHETVLMPGVESNPALRLKRGVERACQSFLGVHLRGVARKWGFPSLQAEEVVLEFLTDLWSRPRAFENSSFIKIVELFQLHLDTNFEVISSSHSEALRPEQVHDLEHRDQREAMIEVMVCEGVDYQHAQRLVNQIWDQEGPDTMTDQQACKRAQNKARRWLRQQTRAAQAVETRLAAELRQGLLTTSELAMHGLAEWLVTAHGFDRDDATHAVWSILARRQEQTVGSVVMVAFDAFSKTTE